ncbi:hypothetical protein DPMN_130568 [Dreissena polymorpha]|uniref:Uncharacterized protein n=2 Tax=Dreissena polymorpha TaxID=45954 RepID=A0A9D4H350_DREPO|nr:hypothetical protein DPMN_127889 [Dreissena polymorpha]KAH3828586.1 hypothetical protein DPMN_130568 [Dreissena polymorpha]
MRWNADRQIAATSTEKETVLYDSRLKTAANRLSQELFNKDIFPTFQPPNKYTDNLNFYLLFYSHISLTFILY